MNTFWNTAALIRGAIIETVAEAGNYLIAKFSGRGEEIIENRDVIQNYGLQSRPRKDCEVVALRQGNSIIVVASDDKTYRLALADGDVILYSDIDNLIKLKGDGGIEINGSSDINITINGTATITADSVKLGGGSGLQKLVTETVLILLSTHTHNVVDVPTTPPTMLAQPSGQLTTLPTAPANKTSIVEAK